MEGAGGGRQVGRQVPFVDAGDERGLRSAICYRIGSTSFGDCVGFDSVAFSGVIIISGKNIGFGVGLPIGLDLRAGSSSASSSGNC